MSIDLDGKPLRYLIGGNDGAPGRSDEVIEFSYDAQRKPLAGIGIKYGNLFDETNSGKYPPYLPDDDVSNAYDEGRIDPEGAGWTNNINDQCARARAQGFSILELDNADSYDLEEVLSAVDLVWDNHLNSVAKNPLMCRPHDLRSTYVGHPAIVGVIVERNCGSPHSMQQLRVSAGKPTLPVWFVAWGDGQDWALEMADEIQRLGLYNMGVTMDPTGKEYAGSRDILRPKAPPPQPANGPVVRLEVGSTAPVRLIIHVTANVVVDIIRQDEG